MNSYIFLYEFIYFLQCNASAHKLQARSASRRAKPELTSCPNQAAPGCPDC